MLARRRIECTTLVVASFYCGCETFVNGSADVLSSILQRFQTARCQAGCAAAAPILSPRPARLTQRARRVHGACFLKLTPRPTLARTPRRRFARHFVRRTGRPLRWPKNVRSVPRDSARSGSSMLRRFVSAHSSSTTTSAEPSTRSIPSSKMQNVRRPASAPALPRTTWAVRLTRPTRRADAACRPRRTRGPEVSQVSVRPTSIAKRRAVSDALRAAVRTALDGRGSGSGPASSPRTSRPCRRSTTPSTRWSDWPTERHIFRDASHRIRRKMGAEARWSRSTLPFIPTSSHTGA